MKTTFTPGRNMALKVPAHEYDKTVTFSRDVLGLTSIKEPAKGSTESVRFAFDDKVLWIDRVAGLGQAEIWMEIVTSDPDQAAIYLAEHGCTRRDEIEALPANFKGCWVSSPCNIIHLVTAPPSD